MDRKVKAKKKFGQNFINNLTVVNQILEGANVNEEDIIVEIGPGAGFMTKQLAIKSKQVFCVEIDRSLQSVLSNLENDYANIEILYDDFLKIDYKEYLAKRNIDRYKVVANLPYYITSPILMKLLEEDNRFDSITIMVQQEVGNRLVASPKSKDYGALTLLTNILCDVNVICEVDRTMFNPSPNVDSVVVKLTKNENQKRLNEMDSFKKLVKASFFTRRKKIINSIKNSGLIPLNKVELEQIFDEAEISTSLRGEAIDIDSYIKLSNIIGERIRN